MVGEERPRVMSCTRVGNANYTTKSLSCLCCSCYAVATKRSLCTRTHTHAESDRNTHVYACCKSGQQWHATGSYVRAHCKAILIDLPLKKDINDIIDISFFCRVFINDQKTEETIKRAAEDCQQLENIISKSTE